MPETLDFAALQRFTPLGSLSSDSLREICDNAMVKHVPAGKTLFRAGEKDDWSVYLLDGRVDLTFPDDSHECVSATGNAARMPLAPQSPRPANAVAVTDVSVVRVRRSLLEVHVDTAQGVEVEEIAADDECLQNSLLQQMFVDYANDRIEVPVLPEVARRLQQALTDPNVNAVKLAELVSSDPSVAARLVKIANSPACRGVVEIGSCRDAVARLGLAATRDIVTAMVMNNVFRSDSALLNARMQELWRSCARVAAISCVLASTSKVVSPDRALMAGLVHDLGAIAVVAGANAHPALAERPGALDAAIDGLRAQFGSMILRGWGFADDLVTTVLESGDWERDPSPNADCCDVVVVARLLSAVGTPEFLELPSLRGLPAFNKLGLGELSPDNTLEVVQNADALIAELERTLAP